MDRRSWLFTCVATIVAVVVICLTIFIYLEIRGYCKDSQETCLTPECVQIAARILSHLDTTVNPCDNFYKFACGNFLRTSDIPDDKDFVSTLSIADDELQLQLRELLEEPMQPDELQHIRTLKMYYQACNNIVAIEQHGLGALKNLLNTVGGWPVLDGLDWKINKFDWYDYMYKFKELGMDTDFFISLYISTDIENLDSRVINLNLPRLSLFPSFLTKNSNNEFVRVYYHYMVSVAKKMGANETRAVDELNQSLEFETLLAHISHPDEEPLSLTLSELEDLFPGIPWFEYVNNLMLPHVVVTKNEKIVVRSPEYIKSLSILLSKTSRRVQANYIMWRAVATLIPYLSEELRERGSAFESVVSATLEKLPRWQECVREVNNRLPLLLSFLYVQKHFSEESKHRATAMFQTVKKEFFNNRQTLKWLDDTTTGETVAKVSNIPTFIAYPESLLNDAKLEYMYHKLSIHPDEYLQSHLNIRILDYELSRKSLREPVIAEDWPDIRTVVEMHTLYDAVENSMSFSAGALQGLLFNRDHPEYLNYGGFGFTAARELAYAFTDIKRQFHEHTDYMDSSEMDYEEIHIERFQCLIQQYSNFTATEAGERINGSMAITEIITDNVALKIAYLAYQKWLTTNGPDQSLAALKFTPNQLFWISFALNQCSKYKSAYLKSLVTDYDVPVEFRVIGATLNLEYFAKDFRCITRSLTSPSNKCRIG